MPYVCLANTTIPDGVVQINDLLPNVSLRSNTDPAGQNRYVNRAQNEAIKVSPTTGQAVFAAKGLRAYLADRVVPGGNTPSTGTITLTGVRSDTTVDTVTIAGVTFTAVLSGADATNRQFNAGAPLATVTCLGALVADKVTIAGVDFTAAAAPAIPPYTGRVWDQSGDDIADALDLKECINADVGGALAAALGALTVTASIDLVDPTKVVITGATTNPLYDAVTFGTSNNTRLAKSGTTLDYPNVATAASLVTALGDLTALTGGLTLIRAALGSTRSLTAANGGTNVVTLTPAITGAPATTHDVQFLTLGTLASTSGTREALSGTALKNTSGGLWTAAQLNTAATNLLARVNNGQALAVGDVNTVLAAVVANTSLTAGSSTDGALTDILEIMAGREYYVPANAQVYQAAYLPLTIKSAAQGSFNRNVTVFDSQMVNGEIRPIVRTGDVVAYDRKGIRSTVDGSAFQLSLAAGTINHFAAGITLLPDSDPQDPITWTYQKASNTTNVASQRIVTVYDDDGSLLA